MPKISEMSAEQILVNYAIAKREYKRVYAELKELEEEMDRRVTEGLERNRMLRRKGNENEMD